MIVIPAAANAKRYRYAVFSMVALVIWFVMFILALTDFFDGVWSAEGGQRSTVFMFGWTVWLAVGGMFVAWFLFQTLRPPVPASLRLAREGIDFNSGIKPRRFVDLGQLKSLRQCEFETGTRLTVEIGNERIEIARGATEVERDWLFRLLVDRYHLKKGG